MHIPDGYLSPETCVVMYGAAAPFWYQASKRVKLALQGKAAPTLAIFAALSFTIQMFNFPVPPGTTAHAVGGTLLAIVLGPSAAVVGVSIALILQALFFADGGVTAIGANAFNMAIALPLSGYFVYSIISRGTSPSNRRRVIAAAIGGYVGINVAGVLVALELGVQPVLWSVAGHALYNPYGLSATLPAMALTHLTIAGFAEAAFTALVVAYLLRTHPTMLISQRSATQATPRASIKPLLVILALLIIIVPAGLLATGSADFEWQPTELEGMVGYIPAGMAQLSGIWQHSPLSDYGATSDSAGVLATAIRYVLSAVVGVALIFILAITARLTLSRRSASRR